MWFFVVLCIVKSVQGNAVTENASLRELSKEMCKGLPARLPPDKVKEPEVDKNPPRRPTATKGYSDWHKQDYRSNCHIEIWNQEEEGASPKCTHQNEL